MSSAGTKKRMQRSAAEQKAYKARQMAAMRDLASLRRDPVALSQLGITTPLPPMRMKGEVKCLDNPQALYTLNTTASITAQNLIRAGSSFFNRIGRKVNLKSLEFKAYVQPIRTVASQDYLRVMIVYDHQTNGTAPSISDIIQDIDQAGSATVNAQSSPNLNNRDRFRILYDEKILAPSITVTAGVTTNLGPVDPVQKTFEISRFIKLKGLHTQYKADSSPAVVGDIATGGLFLVTFGNIATGNEGWQLTSSSRLRYYDN